MKSIFAKKNIYGYIKQSKKNNINILFMPVYFYYLQRNITFFRFRLDPNPFYCIAPRIRVCLFISIRGSGPISIRGSGPISIRGSGPISKLSWSVALTFMYEVYIHFNRKYFKLKAQLVATIFMKNIENVYYC